MSIVAGREGPLSISVVIASDPGDERVPAVFEVALGAVLDDDEEIRAGVDRLVAMAVSESEELDFVDIPGGARAYVFGMPGGIILAIEWATN